MATVQRIMAEHQGSIELVSEEGQGTTITLRLPGPPADASVMDTGGFPVQPPERTGPCA
jgi:signal transduction histidine kinase